MASINLQGDTSGSISISAPSVAGSNTLTLPASTQTLATQNALGVRNLVINGDMRIAQRGTSVTGLSSGYGYKTVDRFMFDTDGTVGTWTMSQDTDVPTGQGFANSVKYTCTAGATISSNASLRLNHYIEAQNLQHLKYGTANAESVTLSFWVKSNKTGTFAVWLYAPDGGRAISNLVTISSADTWEKKTVTYVGDTSGTINNDNGTGILVVFHPTVGTNYTSGTLATSWETLTAANLAVGQTINLSDTTSNYMNITGIQLEVGTEATPFEHRPYDMELARCQRYYEVNSLQWYNAIYGNAFRGANKPHRVLKRATPTGSIVSGTIRYAIPGVASYSADSNAGLNIVSVSNDSWFLSHTRQAGGSTPSNGVGYYCETNPYVAFDAEL